MAAGRSTLLIARPVGQMQDPALVRLCPGECELRSGAAVGEQPPHEGAAATDVEVAVEALLQLPDRFRPIRAEDRRVVPLGALERRRDDVLRRLIHERSAGIVLGGPALPRRREHLEGTPPQEQRLAGSHDRTDGLPHLRIERVVHRPARLIEDAVQRDELVYRDLPHARLLERLIQSASARLPSRSRTGKSSPLDRQASRRVAAIEPSLDSESTELSRADIPRWKANS